MISIDVGVTMNPQQSSNNTMPTPSTQNHYKIIGDLLVAVQKQQDLMDHLTKDLVFFRDQFKKSLEYDNGDGCYLDDIGDETINLKFHMDLGNGTVGTETAIDYMGYISAMNNFQMGFEKTKDNIEKIWKVVDVVRNVDENQLVQKDSLMMPKWQADELEKGRKAALQEPQS